MERVCRADLEPHTALDFDESDAITNGVNAERSRHTQVVKPRLGCPPGVITNGATVLASLMWSNLGLAVGGEDADGERPPNLGTPARKRTQGRYPSFT